MLLVLLLALLEGATRLIFSSNTVLNINIGGFKEFHPSRRAALKPNYEAGTISINSHGLAGPEFEIERSANQIRILCIGDSVTFSPPQNYCRILEDILQDRFADVDIEVIVAAVPGYSSYEALDWYEEFLNKLRPDIATIYLGWNDMGQYHPFGLRYKNERLYREQTLLGWLMERSYAARIPYFFLGRMEQSRPIDLSPLTDAERAILETFYPQHYEDNLETLIRRLQEAEASTFLISLTGLIALDPDEQEIAIMHMPRNLGRKLSLYKAIHSKYQQALLKVSRQTGTPIVDMTPTVENTDRLDVFTDTMHISATGARLYADVLADELNTLVSQIAAEYETGKR